MSDDPTPTHNHWSDDGDLIIEEKTMFRPVGYKGHSGRFFYHTEEAARREEPGGYSPVYEQIATWQEGEGWHD